MSLRQMEAFADPRLGEDLLWRDIRVERFSSPTPALFLDRDGVIIEEKNYISDPNQVDLLPGVADLIRAARLAGMAVIEITNQAGIGRGKFGWHAFVQVENRVREVLGEQHAQLDAVFACAFHEQGNGPYKCANHAWRKPNPGMLLEAARLLNLDLAQSMLVGDKAADQGAARAAGLPIGIHVLTGYGKAEKQFACALSSPVFTVHVVENASNAGALFPFNRVPVLSRGDRR